MACYIPAREWVEGGVVVRSFSNDDQPTYWPYQNRAPVIIALVRCGAIPLGAPPAW